MAKQKTQIWVHPDFKKKLKIEAAEKGMGLLDFTEKASRGMPDPFSKVKPKKQKTKTDYGFFPI